MAKCQRCKSDQGLLVYERQYQVGVYPVISRSLLCQNCKPFGYTKDTWHEYIIVNYDPTYHPYYYGRELGITSKAAINLYYEKLDHPQQCIDCVTTIDYKDGYVEIEYYADYDYIDLVTTRYLCKACAKTRFVKEKNYKDCQVFKPTGALTKSAYKK